MASADREGSNWRGKMSRPSPAQVGTLKVRLLDLESGMGVTDPWGQFDNDPDLGEILETGRCFHTDGLRFLWGNDGACHWNVSRLFREGSVSAIVIGYAYHPWRQGWFQHTWAQADGRVVETTRDNEDCTVYFGIALGGEDAEAFAAWTEMHPPGNGVVRMMR